MKRMYKNLLIAAGLTLGLKVAAQPIPLYQFQQYQGTYAPISGGLMANNSTWDDNYIANTSFVSSATGTGIPIGFNFTYGGNIFDVFGVNNNGWIFLGNSANTPAVNGAGGSTFSNPLSYNTSAATPPHFANRIGAFTADLYGQTGSTIRMETIGVAPSRTLVVQWDDIGRASGSSGGVLDFQIRLVETTNIVQVVYGTVTFLNSGTAQIGLRGSAAVTDFNMRTRQSPTAWSASNPATAIGNTIDYGTTLAPASGQVYQWDPPPACTIPPAMNTAVPASTLVCPGYGVTSFSLATTYTNAGISYSWQSSNSAVGPFTNITGANGITLTTPTISANTYFQLVAACINAPGNMSTTPVMIEAAATTTNTVPYYEGFEGIPFNNILPNCSWAANAIPGITQTYTLFNTLNRGPRTGNKYAAFYMSYTNGPNYFYTNGIEMHPGITYSASLWYKTEFNGYVNVTDLSILYNTSQSATGATTIASTNGPAGSGLYKSLSGLFTVPTTGLYYLAIRASGNGNYGVNYLSWDDLSVIIPCDAGSPNTPTVAFTANSQTICSGENVDLDATGADTYTWSTGANGPSITEFPNINTTYYVTGSSDLTGCSMTYSQAITVNQSPNVYAYATDPNICLGTSVDLVAVGSAQSYTWNAVVSNPNANVITVVPTATGLATYSLSGSNNSNGCISNAVVQVSVSSNPNIVAQTDVPSNTICKGESVNLSATGGATYSWASSNVFVQAPIANVSPMMTTTYSLTGTNANGCSSKTTIIVTVNECTGLNKIANTLTGISVYPNPTSGLVTIELNNTSAKTVQVTDLTGRVIMSTTSNDTKVNLNINSLANGIYYVKIQSENASEVIKVVKQ